MGSLELSDKHLEVDEYFLVDNQDHEVDNPVEGMHLLELVDMLLLAVVEDTRHLVLVVVGMRCLEVDKLVH